MAHQIFFYSRAAAACIQHSYSQMGYLQTKPIVFHVILRWALSFFYQLLSLLSTFMHEEEAHNTDTAVHSTANTNPIVLFNRPGVAGAVLYTA